MTTLELNNLTSENVVARTKEADLVSKKDIADFVRKKTDFDETVDKNNKNLIQVKQKS